MTFSWLMRYFKKQKSRTTSNSNQYELEKNIGSYMVKCKKLRKKKRKSFLWK